MFADTDYQQLQDVLDAELAALADGELELARKGNGSILLHGETGDLSYLNQSSAAAPAAFPHYVPEHR